MTQTVIYLARQALFEDAEELGRLAVSTSETANGPDHLDTVVALSALFYHYAMQHDFTAAKPYGERALEIRKRALGLRDSKARSSLHYLAYVYDASGEKTRATSLLKEAVNVEDYVAV